MPADPPNHASEGNVDFSGFYTDTHEGVDAAARTTPEEVATVAAEVWRDAEALYAFREVIALGGMGAVLRMWDPRVERDIAMKVLLPPITEPRVARFWREARLTAALTHPNIVAVHEIGLTPLDEPYFTMKQVDGEGLHYTLAKWAAAPRRQQPPLAARIRIARRVCDAIAYAHERGVTHLDVKPQNVLVGAFGEVIVIDWGVAKIEGDEFVAEERPAGTVIGTPGFMAPEQARGDNKAVSLRTDVYALGALVYALATLKPPLVGDNLEQVLAHNRDGRVVPPHQRSDCPVALSRVIMKAMAADPADRYATVGGLIADLEAWTDGRAPVAASMGVLGRTGLLLQRNRTLARALSLIAVVAACLLVAGLVRLQVERDRASAGQAAARSAEALARQQLTNAESARHLAVKAQAAAEQAAYAAEIRFAQQALRQGRRAAAAAALARCAPARRDWSWYWLQQGVDSVRWQTTLAGAPIEVGTVGESLVALSENQFLIADGDQLVTHPTAHPYNKLWTLAPGQPVVVANAVGGLGLHDSQTGRQIWATAAAPRGIAAAVSVGDGQHLLLAVGDQLQLFDFTANRIVRQMPGGVGFIRAIIAAGDGERFLVAGDAQVVGLFDLQAGAVRRRYAISNQPAELLLDLRHRRLLLRSATGAISLLDLSSGFETTLSSDPASAMSLSGDGNSLALAHRDGSAAVWSLTSLRAVAELPMVGNQRLAAVGWRKGNVLLVDRTGKLGHWSLPSWPVRLPGALSAGGTPLLAVAPNGVLLAATDRRLLLFDPDSPSEIRQVELPAAAKAIHAANARGLALAANGQLLAVNYAGATTAAIAKFDEPIVTAAFASGGDQLAVRTASGRISQLQISTGRQWSRSDLADGELLACHDDASLLIRTPAGLAWYGPTKQSAAVWQKVIPQGSTINAAVDDHSVRLLVRGIPEMPAKLTSVATADGSIIAEVALPTAGQSPGITAFTPSGILVIEDQNLLMLTDAAGNQLLSLEAGYMNAPLAAVAGTATVAIAEKDGTIVVWHCFTSPKEPHDEQTK